MVDKPYWIIIPAFNAAKTIAAVIEGIRKLPLTASIVVVDDGSSDETKIKTAMHGVEVISNKTNKGYGAAIKRGVSYALGQNGRFFVTIGADNQRNALDILLLLEGLRKEGCDIVIGSKFLSRGQKMPLIRKTGNMTLTWIFNKVFNTNFSDVTSGFKAFGRSVAGGLSGLSDSYSFDIDLCAMIARQRLKYKEIPVRVYYHSDSTRMKNIFLVGLSLLFTMLKRRLSFEEKG